MADGVLFVLLNDFLPVIGRIFGSGFYYQIYLVLNFDKQVISVRLSFDKLYGMPHQFH